MKRLCSGKNCAGLLSMFGQRAKQQKKVFTEMIMRRMLVAGFLLLFSCTLFAGERPKIGVMKFDVAANLDPQLGGFLYDVLLDRVVSSGKYTVVDWEQIDRVLRYIEASQPNVSEEDARRQAGNQLGIEQMYVGSLRRVGGRFYVYVKVLNLDLTVADSAADAVNREGELYGAISRIASKLLGDQKEGRAVGETPAVKGRLYVKPTPADARVRILNIKPRYRHGIELAPGSYHIEVSKPGYVMKKQWIRVAAGDDKVLEVALEAAQEELAPRGAPGAAEKGQNVIGPYIRGLVTTTTYSGKRPDWCRRSVAEQGDVLAMLCLAGMYHNGEQVTQDYAEALHWFRQAAEKGVATAMYNVGVMYERGQGVAKDYAQALKWYRQAAEQGDTSAMVNLAGMYLYGYGVAQDGAQAAYWYRQAAEKGSEFAMHNLGAMYDWGDLVAKDVDQAVYWYRRGAKKEIEGYTPSADRLKELGY